MKLCNLESSISPPLGEIPFWVHGRLIRNGPGMFEVGDTKYHHWFDGHALLHNFVINKGMTTKWYLLLYLVEKQSS